MAEGQGNIFTRFLSDMNPVNRVRDFGANWRNHPGQTAVTTGLGLVPIAGPALSGIARLLFENRNNSQTNNRLEDMIAAGSENLNNQIFPGGTQPQGAGAPRPAMGSMGPSGGMAGITSPWTGQNNQQSPLMSMLGIPDYANGNPGQMVAPQGQAQAPSMGGPSQSYGGGFGASTSLGGNGATVGSATMSGIESMLGAGIGQNNRAAMMTPGREVNSTRAELQRQGIYRQPGQSVQDYLRQ